ncbi:MAG: hypothetical protein ACI857_002016, partial [Arenicella sp.]
FFGLWLDDKWFRGSCVLAAPDCSWFVVRGSRETCLPEVKLLSRPKID